MRKKAEIGIDLGKRLPVKQKRERREERNRLFLRKASPTAWRRTYINPWDKEGRIMMCLFYHRKENPQT